MTINSQESAGQYQYISNLIGPTILCMLKMEYSPKDIEIIFDETVSMKITELSKEHA